MRKSAQDLVSLKFNSSELYVNMDQTEAKVNVCLMKGHAKRVVRIAGREHDELLAYAMILQAAAWDRTQNV